MLKELRYNSLANICHRIFATVVSLDDEAILVFFWPHGNHFVLLGFTYGPYYWDDMERKKRFLSSIARIGGG